MLASCASTAPATSDAAASMPSGDIVDTAVAAGSFNTLAAALSAAGLVDTLKGPGPFTARASSTDADASVMKMADGTMVKTAGGEDVKLGVTSGGVTVNGSSVIKTDIDASNGIIHVVDSVIMPN